MEQCFRFVCNLRLLYRYLVYSTIGMQGYNAVCSPFIDHLAPDTEEFGACMSCMTSPLENTLPEILDLRMGLGV